MSSTPAQSSLHLVILCLVILGGAWGVASNNRAIRFGGALLIGTQALVARAGLLSRADADGPRVSD